MESFFWRYKIILSEAVVNCHVRGNSLEGYTKRSGRNPGHSPGSPSSRATVCKTVPCYTSDNDEVLPSRQPYGHDLSEGFAHGYDRFALYSLTGWLVFNYMLQQIKKAGRLPVVPFVTGGAGSLPAWRLS